MDRAHLVVESKAALSSASEWKMVVLAKLLIYQKVGSASASTDSTLPALIVEVEQYLEPSQVDTRCH